MTETEEEITNRFRILGIIERLLNEWPWSGIGKYNAEVIESRKEELYDGIWSLLLKCSEAGVKTDK